jgi:hypothetical protein
MKIPYILTTLLLATQQIYSADVDKTPGDYKNKILQISIPDKVVTDLQVISTSSGEKLGEPIVTDGGSEFHLWTTRNTPAGVVATELDSTLVRQFNPKTKITFQTDDPYNDPENPAYLNQTGPRRTRADKQFLVNVNLTGLLTDPSKNVSFRMINLYRDTKSYFPSKSQISNSNIYIPQPTIQLTENNDLVNPLTKFPYVTALNSPDELLPSDKIRYACGEEKFTAMSLAYKDEKGNNVVASVLDKKTIQIWPKSRASIEGIAQGQIIKRKIPDITFSYKDLYPLSSTFVIIYPGLNKQSSIGRKFDDNGISTEGTPFCLYLNTTNESFSKKTMTAPINFDTYFPTDGWWTIEIITTTPKCPWEPDSLCYVEFQIDRSIKINATLTTSE